MANLVKIRYDLYYTIMTKGPKSSHAWLKNAVFF